MRKIIGLVALLAMFSTGAATAAPYNTAIPAKPAREAKKISPSVTMAAMKQKQKLEVQQELAAWSKLSKEDKLKQANANHLLNVQRMKDGWAKTPDDMKIQQRERMLHMQAKNLGVE